MKMVTFFLDVSYFRRIVSLIDQMHTQYFRGFILHYNITPVSSIDRDYRHNPYLSLTFFPSVYQAVYYIQYYQVFNIFSKLVFASKQMYIYFLDFYL